VAGAYISGVIGAVGIIPGALSGAATSGTLGALSNVMTGEKWDSGLGLNLALGGIGGGISGGFAARTDGANLWFGTASKPSTTVIAGQVDKAFADGMAEYRTNAFKAEAQPTTMASASKSSQFDGLPSDVLKKGSFSVADWKGYPEGGIKPAGPFRLLEGAEYTAARNLANSTNASLRNSNPEFFKGLQIHEIQPVKFGGSPSLFSNKLFLSQPEHIQYTNFWNALMRSNK
jgi:hypothetical protein